MLGLDGLKKERKENLWQVILVLLMRGVQTQLHVLD